MPETIDPATMPELQAFIDFGEVLAATQGRQILQLVDGIVELNTELPSDLSLESELNSLA